MHSTSVRRSIFGRAALLLGVALVAAPPAAAQRSGDGFLFREPVATVALRGGFDRASAGSDLFSFTTEHLTLDRDDFSGPTLEGELELRLTPRITLAFGASHSGATATSEFREWVDQDDFPIEQTTDFQRVPITASARAYLTPRGRSVGRLAWVPARVAPYLGAGAGAMWYRFRQHGDFADFETLEVFGDELESSGWAPTARVLAGLDVSLSPRIALTGETRYSWAKAQLSDDFQDFDPLDLSGLSASVGIRFRY